MSKTWQGGTCTGVMTSGLLLVMLMTLALGSSAHAAQQRFALLIGNKTYADAVGPLTNPHNDIARVGAALKRLGFKVTLVQDVGFGRLQKAIKKHTSRLSRAGADAIGFFYYSGHGAAHATTRTSYLIPTDVASIDDEDLWDNSVRLTRIIDELRQRAGNATHFVVFDACRNKLKLKKRGSKALVRAKGFVPERRVPGLLIADATAEGEVASDIGQGVGAYAKILAEDLLRRGVEAVSMFSTLQLPMSRATKQWPWLDLPPLPEVYLAGRQSKPAPAPPVPPGGSPAQPVPKRKPGRCDGVKIDVAGKLRCLKPGSGEVFRDCADCPEMVIVPADSFMMGSPKSEAKRDYDEGPQREVRIGAPFAVGRFEVTRAQFEAFFKAAGHEVGSKCHTDEKNKWKERPGRSFRNPGFTQDGSHPVVCVNWQDAKAYVAWLSKRTSKRYRLLSEAEWEYVARAGTTTPFWWGSSISTGQANYEGNYTYGGGSKGKYRKRTVKVDSFKPNPWGLYQVHGNVWEWVADCWHKTYTGAPTDGSAWTIGDCSTRILRGGAWVGNPWDLRSANRLRLMAVVRGIYGGFRVARTLKP